MNAFIRKTTITARLLAMTLAAVALASCSSDDKETAREELTQNGITLTASTVSSLSFEWEAVANASQYGYRLLNGDGEALEGGVTTDRAVSFTGLTDDTEYTFEVTSFATYDSQYKNGEAKTISVRTDKIVPLAAPVLASEVKNEKISVSWDAVENADKYYVKVTDSEGTERNDTIADTSYSLTGTVGLTYSVSVSADTEAEAYSQSEWATAENLVPEKTPRTEIWRVTGSLNEPDITGTTMDKTLVAYDDGSYSLLDFIYDGTGCNLDFEVTSGGEISITNGGTPVNGYTPVTCYDNYVCYIYASAGYTSFDASQGKLWYYSYSYNGGYAVFTWNPDDVVYAGKQEVWRVTGSFTDPDITGATSAKTLVAYSDGTYSLLDFIYDGTGYNLDFSVNDNGTINIENPAGDKYNGYTPVTCYDNYLCYIYAAENYCLFDAAAGDFWFYSYSYNGGYCEFKWNQEDVVKSK